ncbi:hypothetical protein ACROYT_G014322 [Oculina patagonica]
MHSTNTAPAVQAELHTLSPAQLQFNEKLDSLKKVLPFASEVQLASLLTLEGGNMNIVVQCILDSGTGGEDAEQADKRVIDLTDDETLSSYAVARHDVHDVLNLTQVPLDTKGTWNRINSPAVIDIKASCLVKVDSSRVYSLITDFNTLENVALSTLPLKPEEPEDAPEDV